MAYRPYRGHRRRRGPGKWSVFSIVLAASAVVLVAWYFRVPMPAWVGYRSAEAVQVVDPEPPAAPAESPGPHLARGEEALASGRWADAADSYRLAVDVDPGLAVAHARRARALVYQSRLDEAIEHAKRATDLDPASPEARAVLALALDWSGQPDRAVHAALRAVEIDGRYVPALCALAEAYTDLYRLREADEILDDALALGPNDPEVYRVQGNLRETRSDYAGAVNSYRRALELAPGFSHLHVSLGHALRAQKLHEEAIAAFARAAELAPTDARAEGGLGMVYAAIEDTERATQHLRRALEIDARYPTAYAQLAWIHYGRREYEQAAPLFEQAIALDREAGRVAQYRHALGWIYLTSQRPNDAREQFTRALELNPSLQGAKDGLEALRGRR